MWQRRTWRKAQIGINFLVILGLMLSPGSGLAQVISSATLPISQAATPTTTPNATVTPTLPPDATITPATTTPATYTPSPTTTSQPTSTSTPTTTPTLTGTATPSTTATPPITVTVSATPSPTITVTPTITATPTITVTPTITPTLEPGTIVVGPNITGTLTSPDRRFKLEVPAKAVTETVKITYKSLISPSVPAPAGITPLASFDLSAMTVGNVITNVRQLNRFTQPLTLTLSYQGLDVGRFLEDKLSFLYLDATTKQWQVIPTTVYTTTKLLQANIDHFTEFIATGPGLGVNDVNVSPELGGRLVSTDGWVAVDFPAGAVTETIKADYRPQKLPMEGMDIFDQFYAFHLDATNLNDQPRPRFQKPVSVTISYSDETLSRPRETRLSLSYWNALTEEWVDIPSRVDTSRNLLMAATDHFTPFLVSAKGYWVPPPILSSFDVDLWTGSAAFNYDLEVPPGTGGMQPKLTLSYSSAVPNEMKSDKSQSSWVGEGWNLNVGSIILDDSHGINFWISLNGVSDKLVSVGTNEYRTEIERYWKITFHPYVTTPPPYGEYQYNEYSGWWEVITRDGIVYRLGYNEAHLPVVNDGTGNSRYFYTYYRNLCNQGTSGWTHRYYRWDLDQVTDTHDNTMTLTYRSFKNTISADRVNYDCSPAGTTSDDYHKSAYLSRIDYTSNSTLGLSSQRHVEFNIIDRNDQPQDVWVWETHALQNIKMSLDNYAVRWYDFVYDNNGGHLRLDEFKQWDAGPYTFLPRQNFYYQDKAVEYYQNVGTVHLSYSRRFLTKATNGYGGTATYDYYPQCPKPTGDQCYDQWKRQVVSARTLSPGIGPDETYTYGYSDGYYYHYSDDNGFHEKDEFRGFNVGTVTDTVGLVTEYHFFQGDEPDNPNPQRQRVAVPNGCPGGYVADHRVFRGRPYQVRRWAGSTNYDCTNYDYLTKSQYSQAVFPYVSQEQTWQALDSSPYSTKTTYDYDNNGNMTIKDEFGTSADRYRRYEWSYYPNATANILDKPGKFVISNTNLLQVVAETHYVYDDPSNSYQTPPTKGDLVKLERKADGTKWLYTKYEYDGYGNQTKILEYPNGLSNPANTTTIAYEATYRTFPQTVTNALAQVDTYAFDAQSGNLRSHTDPNNQATQYQYDEFKRLITVTLPLDTLASPTTIYQYMDTSNPFAVFIKNKDGVGTDGYLETYNLYDGLGRKIETKEEWTYGSQQKISGTTYDSRGRVAKEFVPFIWDAYSSSYLSLYTSAEPATSYSYDTQGRLTRVTNPDNTYSQRSYSGRTTVVIDENSHRKHYDNDAFGRLDWVVEFTGTDPNWTQYATTTYSYDEADRLKTVTDNQNNTTTITYDQAGRKTGMVDPDMGTWVYTYDDVGNLVTQTDAKGQTINFTYDSLNRLLKKEYGSTILAQYTYDSAGPYCGGYYQKGHRTGMTDASGSISYSYCYDARGRLVWDIRPIDGTFFNTGYTYDAMDRVKTIRYPDAEIVTNTYGGNALLNSVGSGTSSYAQNITYQATGQPSVFTFGNGLGTTYSYNSANRLASLVTSGSTQNLAYSYDGVGNVKAITDTLASKVVNSTYDELDRLTNVSGDYLATYQYNQTGNITSTNGTAYSYSDTNHKHAVTVVGADSYAYDANGNMISRTVAGVPALLSYDPENRLTAITNSSPAFAWQAGSYSGYTISAMYMEAQSFKATTNKVYGVRLDVKRLTTPASNLWVGLYDVPDAGTPIAQAVVSSSAISTSGGYVDALFSPEASVTVGNTYYIRLRLEDQSTGSYEWRLANDASSVYADGNRYYYSWGCVCFLPDGQNRDPTFAVYSSVTSYIYDGDGALVKKVDWEGTTYYVGDGYELKRLPQGAAKGVVRTKDEGTDHFTNDAMVLRDGLSIPINSGSYLEYGIRAGQASNLRGSVQLKFSDGTYSWYMTANDQNGRRGAWDTNLDSVYVNQWYDRVIPLAEFAGKTVTKVFLMTNDSPNGPMPPETDFYWAKDVKVAGQSITLAQELSGGPGAGIEWWHITANELAKYYLANGQRVAERKWGKVFYLHNDHLGGQNKVTNTSGNWVSTREYQAYGTIRTSAGSSSGTSPSDRLYAGYQLEQTPGIYRVGGRFYDPALARFMQPDTVVQTSSSRSIIPPLTVACYTSPCLEKVSATIGQNGLSQAGSSGIGFKGLDPQLLNRYSYTRGNPQTYVDADGHQVILPFALAGGAVGFGAYAVTHRADFNWGDALKWGLGGAFVGGTLGVGLLVESGAAATVAYAGFQQQGALSQRLKDLPIQTHHLLSIRYPSRWTPRFEEIASKYGLDLGEAWNKISIPQLGRHPEKYHEWAWKELLEIHSRAQGDLAKFMELFEELIKKPIQEHPEMLFPEWWE